MASKKAENPATPVALAAMRRQAPDDAQAVEVWPTLLGCLLPVWVDGKCKRQAGSLRVRLIGGYYQVTLHCPTEGLETSLVVETLVGLLDALERRLNDPGCVWTPDFDSIKKTRQVRIEAVQ